MGGDFVFRDIGNVGVERAANFGVKGANGEGDVDVVFIKGLFDLGDDFRANLEPVFHDGDPETNFEIDGAGTKFCENDLGSGFFQNGFVLSQNFLDDASDSGEVGAKINTHWQNDPAFGVMSEVGDLGAKNGVVGDDDFLAIDVFDGDVATFNGLHKTKSVFDFDEIANFERLLDEDHESSKIIGNHVFEGETKSKGKGTNHQSEIDVHDLEGNEKSN